MLVLMIVCEQQDIRSTLIGTVEVIPASRETVTSLRPGPARLSIVFNGPVTASEPSDPSRVCGEQELRRVITSLV